MDRRARLQEAQLYFVAGLPWLDALPGALEGGAHVFQLRDKHAGDDELLAGAERARELCQARGVLFIVNDRPDLALAAGADGVHLGQDDMDPAEAREIVGPDLLVGRSTHSPAQIAEAGEADYIGVGPVYPTPTKRWRPAVGLDLVRHAAEHAPMPWFAIGGINAETLPEVVGAGARRVAVARAISEAPDALAATRALREGLPVGPRVG